MALQEWPSKDPDEVLDYVINWAARLEEDTISSSVWTVPAGLTKTDEAFDGTTTTVWLAAGVLAANYEVHNRIVTSAGRTMDKTVKIKIRAK